MSTADEISAAMREATRRDSGVLAGDYNEATSTFGMTVWSSEWESIREMAKANNTTPDRIMRIMFKTYVELIRHGAKSDDYWREFIDGALVLVPDSYDGDESPESILLRYLEDMDKLAGILARITSSYR